MENADVGREDPPSAILEDESVSILCKVTRGNSVKLTSNSYNFASTLAIEMYLSKYDAYSILNASQAR